MKTKYIRNGKSIFNTEDLAWKVYDSVNKAKKESRKLQRANGGLGRGSLVLEK